MIQIITKNMKKCDKNNHISNKPLKIDISFHNDRHLVTKTFTPLHYTFRHFTSSHLNFTKLHFNTRHCPLIWLNPISMS